MCEFCKNVDTGDDYNPLVSGKVNFGFFGNVDADVYLSRDFDDFDNDFDRAPVIILGLAEDKGAGVFEQIKKINFCPMCGRDLKAKQIVL